MKTKIYGYYESIQILPQGEQFACANIWKQSWEKNGWECVMLNRSHAQGSNLHQKLIAKLMKISFAMPMEIQHLFPQIAARYSRWAALHAAGGGWMSDYDVVNIEFDSTYATRYESTLSMVCEQPCYLFFATREHCAASINKFIQEDFFADGKIRVESDILGIKNKWSDLEEKMHHVKKGDKPKSELMASLM